MTHHYRHVDVFAAHAFTGNSLAVFPDSFGLSAAHMLSIIQEVRHFDGGQVAMVASGNLDRLPE
ncbi:PhzF family phenazine biosynthesis protein [Streptomyces sp. H27-C3]|uniref:PhzF family phenazine biosynthesis protein n=1 Tax=Streptomyces sp. H27-C3 TaxID=3046305 RepID=UPI0024BB46D0|nr:PhzF family phenazine biosynthesis protein [Streptomyces sp. H27-C3]MDJ0462872.1 PhzF family phenazine biosynthesis protein [Streptomyces sp. H27-C3]